MSLIKFLFTVLLTTLLFIEFVIAIIVKIERKIIASDVNLCDALLRLESISGISEPTKEPDINKRRVDESITPRV